MNIQSISKIYNQRVKACIIHSKICLFNRKKYNLFDLLNTLIRLTKFEKLRFDLRLLVLKLLPLWKIVFSKTKDKREDRTHFLGNCFLQIQTKPTIKSEILLIHMNKVARACRKAFSS